jgi:hypothetical protein
MANVIEISRTMVASETRKISSLKDGADPLGFCIPLGS